MGKGIRFEFNEDAINQLMEVAQSELDAKSADLTRFARGTDWEGDVDRCEEALGREFVRLFGSATDATMESDRRALLRSIAEAVVAEQEASSDLSKT